MNFLHFDLGQQRSGQLVEVSLTAAANVRLMDSSNFSSYKSGRQHHYQGGLARQSPLRLAVPRTGHWYVAVDMQGLRGKTSASVRTLPGPLPEARDAALASVPSLVRPHDEIDDGIVRDYDVFISHASEDKDEFVRPLAKALEGCGLSVWYDEFALRIGDSLRRKIDQGLANSRFGIVVLSESFFKKGWTNYELDGIVSRSVNGEQQLLPIWHKVSKADVMKYSPSLVDKVARSTVTHTPDEIAEEISELILSQG
ncbi:TIR domain-containing protein [Rhizobium sp. PP-F2F-G20b]|nr:TIR domain-containing protein [Rhizobium sp. PP-F2F-G20b]